MLIPVLAKLFASLKIEGERGITLLTMAEGLTVRRLAMTLAPSLFREIWPRTLEACGDIPVTTTKLVAITDHVLEGSRCRSFVEQLELVQKQGGEVPSMLEVVTLIALTYMHSSVRLYSTDPWTYTCGKKTVEWYKVVVGGFALSGGERYIPFGFSVIGTANKGEEYGVSVMKTISN